MIVYTRARCAVISRYRHPLVEKRRSQIMIREQNMSYSIPETVSTKGPFQPMRFEATVEECIVSHGEIPKDLAGGFYRCGPTWKRPTRQGNNPLLSQDGMVQGLVLGDGRADFRNRWVRTPKYQ